MAIIRPYEQQYSTPSADFSGRRSSAEDFALGGIGAGMQDLGRGIATASDIIKKKQEQDEIADAQINMARSNELWTDRMGELQKEAKPGEYTSVKIRDEMNAYFTGLRGNYKSDAARNYVAVHSADRMQQIAGHALKFDVELKVKDQFAKQDEFVDIAGREAARDPSKYTQIIGQMEAEAQAGVGIWENPGDARTAIALKERLKDKKQGIAKKVAEATLRDQATVSAISQTIKSNSGTNIVGAQPVIESIIKREGGFVADDAGKGNTKFGINKTANPDVDIGSLTEAGAAKIYKERYWDKYGLDSVPESVQSLVMDGVVNHGSAFAKQLSDAAKAGASATELAAMRTNEYNRLIAAEPSKYAKFKKSWDKRVADTLKDATSVVEDTEKGIANSVDTLSKQMPWFNDLSDQDKKTYLRDVDTISRRNQSIADHSLKLAIQDQEAFVAVNGRLPEKTVPLSAFTDETQRNKYANWINTFKQVESIMDAPLSKQADMLNKLRPTELTAPGEYADAVRTYQTAVEMVQKANIKREENPIGVAIQRDYNKTGQLEQITDINPDKFIEALNKRMPVADSINQGYGTSRKYLDNKEAETVARYLKESTAQDANNWIQQVVTRLDDPEKTRILMRQISKNDGALWHVAEMFALTKNNPVKSEKATADANAIMLGRSLIQNAPKGENAQDDKAFNSKTLLQPGEAVTYFTSKVPQMNVPTEVIEGYTEAIRAHYIGTMKTLGHTNMGLGKDDPSSNKGIFDKSIKAILGDKYVTTTGATKVPRPYGMDEAEFRDNVQRLVARSSKEKYAWGEYSLIPHPDGYRVQIGTAPRPDDLIIDPTKPFDIEEDFARNVKDVTKRPEQHGFFSNLGAALTGGTLSSGGVPRKAR